MPIYTDDPSNEVVPFGIPLYSSLGVNPKITKVIDAATRDWLDEHPEATTTVGDNSLTNAKFMDGSVNSRVIEDESITTDDIADLAVTTPKIADNAVTADKVASSAVDGLRIMNTAQPGVAKVGAGLAMNNGALELNGGNIAPAVTAWLNAHPEATTTVQDGAVTDAKLVQTGGILETFANFVDAITDLMEPSNVYNKDDVVTGAYMGTNGLPQNAPNYLYTNYYISVNAGDVVNATKTMRLVAAYDSDKVAIAAKGDSVGTKSYVVPDGISYIIPSFSTSATDVAICINQAAVYTPWFEPHYEVLIGDGTVGTDSIIDDAVTLDKVSFARSLNRHNAATDTVGYYVNPATGNMSANSTYNTTDYIEVATGETLYFTWPAGSSAATCYVRYIAAYDENKSIMTAAGHSAITKNWAVPDGVRYVRITFTAVGNSVCVSHKPMYAPYGHYEFDDIVYIDKNANPLVIMPKEICVAVGRTIEIYNRQVCLNADKFHFQWTCNVGYQYGRKFQIVGTSANVGTYTATLTLYNDENDAVYIGTTTIKIVADSITSLKVCPIGDSLTNKKAWLTKVIELNSGIEWVGTRWSASTAVASTYRHEGRSGATANTYLTDSQYTFDTWGETSSNPFWNPTAESFDWAYYKNTYDIDPDAVQIFLGTNGLSYDNSTTVAQIVEMVEGIRSADASIPIYLVNTLYYGNQDGIAASQKNGATDGQTGSFKGVYKYGQDVKVYDLIAKMYEAVDELNDANMHFIPVAFTHDSEYNFGVIETPVNPHATQTELLPSEAVHPQAQGYYQIADIVYSTLCAYQS